MLRMPRRELLRLGRACIRERRLCTRVVLDGVGDQLHELLKQHVLGRPRLWCLLCLQRWAVLGRWLNGMHRFMPRRPVRFAERLRRLPGWNVVEFA